MQREFPMPVDARDASVRAYAELRRRGRPDPAAFEAAVSVLRCRCPEVAPREARFLVADWIGDGETAESDA
ncbi:MAG: hypothetical protein EA406_09320 [Rhodospirillales bacterium]|nr:MAG: hypothetical protein EA406_09320 [Rhodospirillales bacterium]